MHNIYTRKPCNLLDNMYNIYTSKPSSLLDHNI